MAFSFPPNNYEIKSPRLVIRHALPQDAGEFINLLGNVENLPMGETEAMSGLSPENLVDRMEKWKKQALDGKNAFLAIALHDTNKVIGYMGFNCFRSKAEVDGTEPERDLPLPGIEGRYLTDLGVVVDHTQRRKGYSSEVICAAMEFAFGPLGCEIVRVETGVENEPWRALMRFFGFGDLEEKGVLSYGDHPVGWLWKVDEDAWRKVKEGLKARSKWPL